MNFLEKWDEKAREKAIYTRRSQKHIYRGTCNFQPRCLRILTQSGMGWGDDKIGQETAELDSGRVGTFSWGTKSPNF